VGETPVFISTTIRRGRIQGRGACDDTQVFYYEIVWIFCNRKIDSNLQGALAKRQLWLWFVLLLLFFFFINLIYFDGNSLLLLS
jgi:hypothetical protein